MSPLLSSPDLARLVTEGYELEVRGGHLLVHHVPYVTSAKQVAYGTLVSTLNTEGHQTTVPESHVMLFMGDFPCSSDGNRLRRIMNAEVQQDLGNGIVTICSFSQKPLSGQYMDYYAKVTTYVALLVGHAQVLDPSATAQTYRPVVTDEATSVFRYTDSASSQAGIGAYNDRVALPRVAIVGVGGTGAYLLDLLAKVPIGELHLFDGDVFKTHNAYRAPSAATLEQLNARPLKVDYFAAQYSPLRRGLVAHPEMVTADNVGELRGMDYVFLCMDASPDKKMMVDWLDEHDVPFTDTGIGVKGGPSGIGGIIRVTTSVTGRRDHISENQLLSYVDIDDENIYDRHIQVAELNSLAAALAVIRFKKHFGFYRDLEGELHSLYVIDGNDLINEYPQGGDE